MEKKIDITFWSDFACPYCYIGITRLKRVIREMGAEDRFCFTPKSFQLRKPADMDTCPTCGNVRQVLEGTNASHFAQKYGISEKEAESRIDGMYAMGKEEGLAIRYGTAPLCYTTDAHRLVKSVFERYGDGLAGKLSEAIFYVYLTENLDISDHRVLMGIAKGVGLHPGITAEVLNSDDYAADVMVDGLKAEMFGIHLVPHFIVDGKYAIEGAQTADIMKRTLAQAL